jgi:hypothetical protein
MDEINFIKNFFCCYIKKQAIILSFYLLLLFLSLYKIT